jgi:8-oxo-dGTP pyrophosphatase MutT (NUDIX family)
MADEDLMWKELSRKEVFKTRVFSVYEQTCRSPEGVEGKYAIIDRPNWVMVIPVIKTAQGVDFLLVKQWRHGVQALSLEFPGGVIEKDEAPETAAARELLEETACKAGKLRLLGCMSPNPAIDTNRQYYYVAEDLVDTGKQHLDEDEFVHPLRMSEADMIAGMGKPPLFHGLVAAALGLYEMKKTAG